MQQTTIKLDKITKYALDQYKMTSESYANAISRLLEIEKKKKIRELLIEGYKKRAKEQLEQYQEWENASKEIEYDEY